MKHGNSGPGMKTKSLLSLILLLTSLVACSPEPDCFVADSVTQVKTIKGNGINYYVYLRISGFNKKEFFYELFLNEPEFDVCGKSNIDSISDIHIDQDEGIITKLLVKNNKLSAVYTKEKIGQAHLKEITVELVPPVGSGKSGGVI